MEVDASRFVLAVAERVHRALERAGQVEGATLREAILSLETEPLPDGVRRKKLSGVRPALYRLRAGSWRILYEIEGRTVRVLDVVRRRDLETWLRRYRG